MSAVLLGYEVGSGKPVEIPVRHMCVTGQTQEAGKTTTLEALIRRSKLRALTFVTKPGESAFGDARRVRPYFQEAKQNRWRFVAAMLEAHLGERMKFERSWISRASEGTSTLEEVRVKAWRLSETSRGGMNQDQFRMLGVYLDELVPEIGRVSWAPRLELGAGINAMDLVALSPALQQLVIRSAMEWIHAKERDVVVVVPEAWAFVPQGRNTPVKLAAQNFIRQGAALKNYLWLDSQDIGGVDKEVLRSVPVWLLGVQRESNEIKRTLANIPAPARPKAEDVALLELGEFFACWGKHAIRTYVQPAGMAEAEARGRARGERPRAVWRPPARKQGKPGEFESVAAIAERAVPEEGRPFDVIGAELRSFVDRGRRAQNVVDHLAYHGPGLTFGELAIGEQFEWAAPIPVGPEPMVKTSATRYEWPVRDGVGGYGEAEDYYRVERAGTRSREGNEEMNADQEKKLDKLVASVGELASALKKWAAAGPPAAAPVRDGDAPQRREYSVGESLDNEALYQAFKERLLNEAAEDPRVIEALVRQPEIRVKVEKHTIAVDGDTLRGRVALLISEGYFDDARSPGNVQEELKQRGFNAPAPNVGKELAELARMGFFTKNNKWFRLVPSMKRAVVEA